MSEDYDNSEEEHELTVTEPCWVVRKLKVDEDGTLLRQEMEDTKHMAGVHENSFYDCSCGKHFDTGEQARRHIREVNGVD